MNVNINSVLWTLDSVEVRCMASFEEYPESPLDFGVWLSYCTVQDLVSRAEMLDDSRFVWGECLVPWHGHCILDVESTLEFGRWLKAYNRDGMLTLPLEPSILCLADHLQMSLLCIHPIWSHLGVSYLNRDLFSWALDNIKTPIILNVMNMKHSDLEWLTEQGWQSIESTQGVL